MYTVSITSQGQISIPMQIRKDLGFHKKSKVMASVAGGKMILEKVPDLLNLAGSLNKYAKKGLSIDEIIEMESKAWENAAVERYIKSLSPAQLKKST